MNAPEALLVAICGSLLVAVGITAVAVALLRGLRSERALPIFGLFVLLYGFRLLVQSPLVQETTGLPETWFWFAGTWITYAILAPACMFVEAIAAPAFRLPLRLLWQADLVYATLAIAVDISTGRPGSVIWLNAIAASLNMVAGTACLIGSSWKRSWERKEEAPRPARSGAVAAVVGAVAFALLASYETLLNHSPIPGITSAEPIGMLALLVGLGYFVTRRAIEVERRFLTLSYELKTARSIQQSILPTEIPSVPGLVVVARYIPMAEVAGDFYDYLKHGDGRLGILVADVSGHGVPAAIIASMVKIALAAQVDHADDPARVVAGMNRALCGKFEAAFITATYAFLNPGRGHLAYAAAGHPPILLQRPGGAIESLEERGLPIGIDPGAAYTTRLAHLDPGDRLWLYTDGLLEAADPRGTFFGDQQILESLKATGALELPDSVDRLIDDLSAWRGRGASLNDDVTVLAVDLREGAA